MKEIWRDVNGYEGKYQVSFSGQFKNVKRRVILNGTKIHNYTYFTLGKYGPRVGIHILVAKAFPEICGEWFDGAVVHHKDFNRNNNRADNLIVLSPNAHSKLHYKTQPDSFTKPSEKRSKSISKALKGRRAVEKHKPVLCYTKDGQLFRRYECISDVKKDGFLAGNVCQACKRKLKTAYGFIWRYAV